MSTFAIDDHKYVDKNLPVDDHTIMPTLGLQAAQPGAREGPTNLDFTYVRIK